MSNIHNAVRDGESMAVQMDREPVFPTMVTSMVEIGEETGELPTCLPVLLIIMTKMWTMQWLG